jgi:phosphoribosylanthranilate isomerase
MFVKICGITRVEDLDVVVKSGATAVGFIAFPKSPRYVSPEKVKELLKARAQNLQKVAVFVNPTIDEIKSYIDVGIDTIQLHGQESPEFTAQISELAEVWKAFSLSSKDDLNKYIEHKPDKFVIDAYTTDVVPGGTGKTADWDLALYAKENLATPLILAGGLNVNNIEDAMNKVVPFGLDLSSGVEISPGIKNHNLILQFMEKVNK